MQCHTILNWSWKMTNGVHEKEDMAQQRVLQKAMKKTSSVPRYFNPQRQHTFLQAFIWVNTIDFMLLFTFLLMLLLWKDQVIPIDGYQAMPIFLIKLKMLKVHSVTVNHLPYYYLSPRHDSLFKRVLTSSSKCRYSHQGPGPSTSSVFCENIPSQHAMTGYWCEM